MAEAYAEMVKDLEARFYGRVARYSSGPFMRMWLGEALPPPGTGEVVTTSEEAASKLGTS